MQSSEESISAQSNSDNKTLRLEQPVILSPPTLAVTQEYQFSAKVCYLILRKDRKAEKIKIDLNGF